VSTDLESEINRARGGGQPLDKGLQAKMGEAMGADFSGVRVHTDGRADGLNRAVGARAFTTGQDLFFKRGEYQPGSRGGQELIAHELTHVVQQESDSNIKKIQRVAPALLGLGAAEWIALGTTGYMVAGDAIKSGSGDVAYTFDEMEGVLLPTGGSDVAAYRTQNPSRKIYEGTQQLAVFFKANLFDRAMGIKFGITFNYDNSAIGSISLNIIEVYDIPGWGGNINVNITPRNMSSGMSSIRLTVNMATSNLWPLPDRAGSGIFTLRADGDLSIVSNTHYFRYQIG